MGTSPRRAMKQAAPPTLASGGAPKGAAPPVEGLALLAPGGGVSLLALPRELLWVVLAPLEARELARCATACAALRVAARDATDGVLDSLGLAALRAGVRASELNQSEVCAWLGLTADEARAMPHAVVHRRGAMGPYEAHIFDAAATVAALVRAEGWPGVGARLARVEGRKRKRADLGNRRGAARAKRRAAFEDWLVTDAPLGAAIASISAWEAAQNQAGAPLPSTDGTLRKFLEADAVGAPSLKTAKTTALAFAAAQQARAARRSALEAAMSVHGVARRADSRLCAAYEAGAPVAGFATAPAIADEMALARWLHEHTDYPCARDRCADALRDAAGRYYDGINAEARDDTRALYHPHRPSVWPWLGSPCAPAATRLLRLQPAATSVLRLQPAAARVQLECVCCGGSAAKACAHGACAACCPGPCPRHRKPRDSML